jgi:MYXO-CTERM domain-containing protein
MPRSPATWCLSALAALAVVALAPAPALACGGFFCSQVNVDQTSERILFEVNPDSTISLTVEIALTGDSNSFSWLIPLPPETTSSGTGTCTAPDGTVVDTSGFESVLVPTDDCAPFQTVTNSALMLLAGITTPQIIAPPQTGWDDWDGDADGGGDTSTGAPTAEDDGVSVSELPQVDDYQGELISSENTDALVTWLNDNGYVITPEMYPFIAEYVASGMSFLGIQLAPEPQSGIYSIKPLNLRYHSTVPMVPLTLSAVSAEPEMGFVVFIAGADNYEADNYLSLDVNTDLLHADPRTGENNYYPLISWLADQAPGGQAFFKEYSDSTDDLTTMIFNVWLGTADQAEAQQFVTDLAGRHDRITRLYTRMSNWEMDSDPAFVPVAGNFETISNIHDLSGRDPIHVNMALAPPLPCNDTYCGPFGTCATTSMGIDGCACNAGSVARGIMAPVVGAGGMSFTVSCQDASFDLGVGDVEGLPDPCAGVSCGAMGTCMPLNGGPTCLCGPGYAAVNAFGSVTCSLVEETFLASQLLWPNWPPVVDVPGDDDDDDDDDDDTGSTTDDDDAVSTDDDDDPAIDPGADPADDDYEGLDGGVGWGCSSIASAAHPGALALALLALLAPGLLRRRRG